MYASTLLIVASCLFAQIEYPHAPRGEASDTYHGVVVPDPYRWLESVETDQTRAWIAAQNELFVEYVTGSELRDGIERRIGEIRSFDTISTPTKAGDVSVYTWSGADTARSVVYLQRGEAHRVLLDPETHLDYPTETLAGSSISPHGRYLAYGVSRGQNAWCDVRILEVETGKDLPERLVGFPGFGSISWLDDESGFYYRRFDEPGADNASNPTLENGRVLFHAVDTPQSADDLVFGASDDPDAYLASLSLSEDDRFLVVRTSSKSRDDTRVLVHDRCGDSPGFTEVIRSPGRFSFEGSHGDQLWFRTDESAPRGRLIAVDIDDPQEWIDLIPETQDTLVNIDAAGDGFLAQYTHDAVTVAKIFDRAGNYRHDAQLPGFGGGGFSATQGDSDVYFSYSTLFDPVSIYQLDMETGKTTLYRRPELSFDPDDFVLEQVFYHSADGTRVPMFIARRRDVEPSPDTPLWMYGFGHSGWIAYPWFQAHLVAWLETGGIYALPGLRGGGEYGAEWQAAGTRRNKPNTIADFIAAAEWLIDNGYTSSDRLVANGGSASGVVPAAAMVRRPDLFGALVIDVPFLDMIRYAQFAYGFTRGYGSPEDPNDFKVLLSYSPYHTLQSGTCYPPTLVSVAEEDLATLPMHGYKFTAAMQAAQSCESPVLMQMIRGAGHYTYGTTVEQQVESLANQIVFVERALGLPVPAKTD